MYPISLGYEEVNNRLDALVNNGHHAEALLAAVFALEKTIRRTLRFCVINRGFSSKQTDALLKNKGFDELKKLWQVFEKSNQALPDFIGQNHWQHVPEAVNMRNKMVHGGRVYNQTDYQEKTTLVRAAMDRLRELSISQLECDPWKTLPGKQKCNLSWLDVPQPKIRSK